MWLGMSKLIKTLNIFVCLCEDKVSVSQFALDSHRIVESNLRTLTK